MTDGVARRRFLTEMGLGLGVAALGGSLAWWTEGRGSLPLCGGARRDAAVHPMRVRLRCHWTPA
jgi:hypothetical protein